MTRGPANNIAGRKRVTTLEQAGRNRDRIEGASSSSGYTTFSDSDEVVIIMRSKINIVWDD